ncbi:transposase domain-containing protein (plasmid) [Rhodococcus pseudokoreensis]|uniref:Transposase domain-containing protein n=1 Tax=Rhodococcus pseudokoreensis TaxID=2811421 RepID=A0A974VXD1_9NOCA|nr:transposase domain-containing protein [Rhodococcus pseudokoreensis]
MAGIRETGDGGRLTDRIGLGVLTRIVHRDLVDEVLAETGRVEPRRWLLPGASGHLLRAGHDIVLRAMRTRK